MKNKGFTLIELLAVIVILAIIAVIAVPAMLNVIEKAKKGALKDTAYGIIESGELYLAKNLGQALTTIEFKCINNECKEIECDEEDNCIEKTEGKTINYKGTVDEGRIKLYSDGKTSICVENDKYAAIKHAREKEVEVREGTCNYNDDYSIDETISLKKYNELKDELAELKAYGNAKANEILSGKTALVQGEQVTGNLSFTNLSGTETIKGGNSTTSRTGYYYLNNYKTTCNDNYKLYSTSFLANPDYTTDCNSITSGTYGSIVKKNASATQAECIYKYKLNVSIPDGAQCYGVLHGAYLEGSGYSWSWNKGAPYSTQLTFSSINNYLLPYSNNNSYSGASQGSGLNCDIKDGYLRIHFTSVYYSASGTKSGNSTYGWFTNSPRFDGFVRIIYQ